AALYATSNGTFAAATTGSTNLCLLSGASTPTWGSCDTGNTSWVQANGTIYPGNSTEDLLVGGTSTASAKFAFINVAGNSTPTASISGASNNALSFNATGTIQTTNAQSLLLNPNGLGNVGIGLTTPTSALDVQGAITSRGSASGLNLYAQDNSGKLASLVTPNGDLTFYLGLQNRGTFTQAGHFLIGLNGANDNAAFSVKGQDVGNGGIIPVASLSGQTSFAGLVVDNSGSGDLFTASKSGVSKFTIL